MINLTLRMTRLLASGGLVAMALVSTANAQTRPNPPTEFTAEDGTPVPTVPGGLLFFDDFNYVVNKLDSAETKRAVFTAAGWSGYKDQQLREGASGYLSTVTSVPGYSGRMPGRSGSGRVLRLEGLPTTLGNFSGSAGTWRNQTDFYLSYGSPAGPQSNVPGNVWFQFWIYINDYGDERSHWANRNKLIYPSDDGTASGDGTQNAYLISIRPGSQQGTTQQYGARAYVVNKIEAGNGGTVVSDAPEGSTYIGANLRSADGYLVPNRWYLYKVHIDHASEHGRYEVWMRPLSGQWVKTTEWIGGVTPGFTWITQPGLRAGHNMFKIPTTWGTAKQDDNANYDAWVYLADFAIATDEAALPVYSDY